MVEVLRGGGLFVRVVDVIVRSFVRSFVRVHFVRQFFEPGRRRGPADRRRAASRLPIRLLFSSALSTSIAILGAGVCAKVLAYACVASTIESLLSHKSEDEEAPDQ